MTQTTAAEWLTPAEMADALRVHVETVRLWCRTGEIRAAHVGRQWRIHRDVLAELLEPGEAA